jgi:hypothetical protein
MLADIDLVQSISNEPALPTSGGFIRREPPNKKTDKTEDLKWVLFA